MISDIENNNTSERSQEEESQWKVLWTRVSEWTVGVFEPSSLQALLEDVRNAKSTLHNLDHAGQCMFLCLRSRSNYYVVKVPCFRPTRPPIRKARKLRKDAETRVFKRIFAYEPLTASEKVFECDAVLWQRIRDTYFTDKGIWRKWLPFYGPRIVREVEFQFVGTVDAALRYRIFDVTPVDISQARQRAGKIIASQPDLEDDYGQDHCDDYTGYHCEECPKRVDSLQKCILDLVEGAKERKKKLGMVGHLLECANDPEIANGLRTLDGMAQESPIYDLELPKKIILPQHDQPYEQTDIMRGIEMVMGWQFDRIKGAIPRFLAWGWLAGAVIWLCVIVWGSQTGNWSLVIAFAQLLAATITLGVVHVRD